MGQIVNTISKAGSSPLWRDVEGVRKARSGRINTSEKQMYASVEQALAFAFGMEAKVVCKLGHWHGRVGAAADYDPYAEHADAAMITALAARVLEDSWIAAVWAQFTVPATEELQRRKLHAVVHLSSLVGAGVTPSYKRDVCREWAGMSRQHTDRWWSKRLRIGERRLRQLKHGRPERKQSGILGELDRIYDEAVKRLAIEMQAKGLIVDK